MGHHSQIELRSARVFTLACSLACIVGCGGKDGSDPSDTTAASLADELLSAHNQVRDAVTQPTNYLGAWAPLPKLAWSSVVEASAQAWANQLKAANCAVEHQANGPYGENVAGGTAVGYPASVAFNDWAKEKSIYAFNPVYAFDNDTGHYTQIVWRSTTEVGCAMATCPTGYLVYVCRYNPPGNVIGAQPY